MNSFRARMYARNNDSLISKHPPFLTLLTPGLGEGSVGSEGCFSVRQFIDMFAREGNQ